MAPDVIAVTVKDKYVLHVQFETGETRRFDMSPLLHRKCYSSLRNNTVLK